MKRTIPFGIFFLTIVPAACSGTAGPGEVTGGTTEALAVSTVHPITTPVHPILTGGPADSCDASQIEYADSNLRTCRGGIEYRPYVSPCYNGSNGAPSQFCGPMIRWGTTSCHYPTACRKSDFGVKQAFPNRTDTTSLSVQSTSDGYAYCNQWVADQVYSPSIPVSAYVLANGDPSVNWGVPEGAGRSVQPMPGYAPKSSTNPNGPGVVTCSLLWLDIKLFNNFYDANRPGDPQDPQANPCPLDPNAVACQEDPIFPVCVPSSNPVQAPLGLDPDPSACGLNWNGGLAYTPANASQTSFDGQFNKINMYASCTSCEDHPIADPTAVATSTDPGVLAAAASQAQSKLACITNRLNDVSTGRSPSSTFNATLKGELASEAKLLSELEGQVLTPAAQDTVWQIDLQTDDQNSCEAPPWAPASTPPAVCSAPVPSGVTTDFATYMRRGLTACLAFQEPHATIPATAAFAPRCFALATHIPADSIACQYQPGPGPGPFPIDTMATPAKGGVGALSRVHVCVSPDVVGGGSSMPIACDYQAYRDEYRTVANSLIMKLVTSMKIGNDDSTAEIQSKLALIEQWYEGMSALYPPGTDRTNLYGDASAVIGAFWQNAFNAPFNNALANAASPNAATSTNVSNMFLADATDVVRKVFLAAFTTYPASKAPPLRSAPLLYLMSDGVQTITNRLEYVGLFHDMACRFKGCIGGAVQTEVSQMWRVLAALADPAQLAIELKSGKMLRSQWYAIFEDIQQTHTQTIEPAVLDVFGAPTYAPSLLATGTTLTLPTPALGVSRVIQAAARHSSNYITSGLLGSNATNTIDVGLQNVTLGTGPGNAFTLTGEINKLVGELGVAVTDYKQGQQQAVSAILGELTLAQKDAQLDNQLQSAEAQFTHLSQEIVGLQDSDATAEASFGQFLQAYNGVVKGDSVDPSLMISRHFVNATVDPLHAARATGPGWNNITQIAVQPSGGSNLTVPIAASQGWILNIGTNGSKWTPTCALRNAVLPGSSSPVNAEDVLTGPEGYYVSLSQGSYKAVSNSSVDSAGIHTGFDLNLKTCAGGRITGGFDLFGNGAQAYTDTSACASMDLGGDASATVSSTTNNGQEGRTSASFSSGIRVANTPFPQAPVGALLLVETKRGSTSPADVVDVRVVQSPTMSVLVDADVDVYLVDNDVTGCSYSAPGALTLQIAELQPTAQALLPIGKVMATALADIRGKSNQLIAQGKILPDDMALLRATAMAELTAATPANFTIPPSLTALFTAYVEEAIVHMERVVEIATAEYQRQLLQITFKGIDDDVAANANQARYYQLLTAYALVNLDSDALTAVLNPLLAYVMNELYPAAVLRYPNAIAAIQKNAATQLDQLTTKLDWTSVDVALATQAGVLVQQIEGYFENAAFATPQQNGTSQIILSFPNPAFVPPTFGGTTTFKWPWAAASSSASLAVWEAVNAGTVASITLTPDELYKNDTSGLLPCSRFAPVIDDFAVFVGMPSGSTSVFDTLTANGGQPAKLRVHDRQAYPTPAGLEIYHFVTDPTLPTGNPWLNSSSVFAIGGDPNFALQTFNTALSAHFAPNFTAAAGLSPFATFDIDMAGVHGLIAQAGGTPQELDLVLQVESNGSDDLTWIPACKPTVKTGGPNGGKVGGVIGKPVGTTQPL